MSLRKIFWHGGGAARRARAQRPVPSRPIGEELPESQATESSSVSDLIVEEDDDEEERIQAYRTRRRSSVQILDKKLLQSLSTSTNSHADGDVSEDGVTEDACESMSSDLPLFFSSHPLPLSLSLL